MFSIQSSPNIWLGEGAHRDEELFHQHRGDQGLGGGWKWEGMRVSQFEKLIVKIMYTNKWPDVITSGVSVMSKSRTARIAGNGDSLQAYM